MLGLPARVPDLRSARCRRRNFRDPLRSERRCRNRRSSRPSRLRSRSRSARTLRLVRRRFACRRSRPRDPPRRLRTGAHCWELLPLTTHRAIRHLRRPLQRRRPRTAHPSSKLQLNCSSKSVRACRQSRLRPRKPFRIRSALRGLRANVLKHRSLLPRNPPPTQRMRRRLPVPKLRPRAAEGAGANAPKVRPGLAVARPFRRRGA
jgi:hypothetical protein